MSDAEAWGDYFSEREVALVRYKREWRAVFTPPHGKPDHFISFAGVYFYGGKNLKDAEADVRRICSKNGWKYVGRLDKLPALEPSA